MDDQYFHKTDIILVWTCKNWDTYDIMSEKNLSAGLMFSSMHIIFVFILNKTISHNKTDLYNGYQNTMDFIPHENGKIKN